MHYALDAIPPQVELEGLAPALQKFPKGLDVNRLLEGLSGNLCPCGHWGYALKGSMSLIYEDGSREDITAGDVYYAKPGHTAVFKEDFAAVEFSPVEAFRRVMEHVAKKMQAV